MNIYSIWFLKQSKPAPIAIRNRRLKGIENRRLRENNVRWPKGKAKSKAKSKVNRRLGVNKFSSNQSLPQWGEVGGGSH